jgi:uncharacterized membrane protein HdeD (DUF308 family)
MVTLLSKNWWVFLVRGLAAILFGLMAFARPGMTVATLVIFFGAWALVGGIFAVVGAFGASKTHREWWILLLQGLLGIGVGVLTFVQPAITAMAILYYLAFWSILTGVVEIVTAIRLRKELQGEGWIMLAGAASVVFGLILLARPGAGALALITVIGAFALVFGFVLVMAAFRLKKLQPKVALA